MKFNINDYAGNYKIVMHCDTEREATIFCEYLHSVDKTWADGSSYMCLTNYIDDICYRFNRGTHSSKKWYLEKSDFVILEFSDFEWDGYNDNIEVCDEDKEALDNFFNEFQTI